MIRKLYSTLERVIDTKPTQAQDEADQLTTRPAVVTEI